MDEQRFAALVERQSRFVYQVAYAVLRNSFDAEDVVQETFLKLYRGSAWRDIRDERAFLARLAWRLAINRAPRRRLETHDWDLASTEPGPEASAIEADWTLAIRRLMDALPEDLRQPLALSSLDGMNSREIAALMEIPEGTVRTRIMRARELVKQKLVELGRTARERRS